MRLDQDKQIGELAEFQRKILGPEKLAKITENHLQHQGFSPEDINKEKRS